MDDEFEFGDRFHRGVASLEQDLKGKVPKNIEEIEHILGEAMLSNEFDYLKSPACDLLPFLQKKGVQYAGDVQDLITILGIRIMNGEQTYLKRNLEAKRAEALQNLERMKDRQPIKEAMASGVLGAEAAIFIERFMSQDTLLTQGKTFNEVFTTLVYSDCPSANLAFVLLVEEKTGKKIDSPEALRDLAGIDPEIDFKDVQNCYFTAREHQLDAALEGALRAGAKWHDLLDFSPAKYGLPEKWTAMRESESDLVDSIRRAIYFFFHFGDQMRKRSVRDVADFLGAPYEQVLRASMYYEH